MRMREDYGMQLRRWQSQMRINLACLLPVPLKQSAVQQDVLSRTFEMMRRSGDCLRRTPELQSNRHVSP